MIQLLTQTRPKDRIFVDRKVPGPSSSGSQSDLPAQKTRSESLTTTTPLGIDRVDILVAGSLAADTICDYAPFSMTGQAVSPALHTSNPASISQSAGGVGRNVATSACMAGASVALASVVADDLAGVSLLDQVNRTGVVTRHVRQLRAADGARTAQYIAVNDGQKDLVMAMADMEILGRSELEAPGHWVDVFAQADPKWVVVDANWSAAILSIIVSAAKARKLPVAFEPVSVAKAARLFGNSAVVTVSSVVPKIGRAHV